MPSLTDWDISVALDKSYEQEPRWEHPRRNSELDRLVVRELTNLLGEVPVGFHLDYAWWTNPGRNGGTAWELRSIVGGPIRSGWTLGGAEQAAKEIAQALAEVLR